jgi:hypothetical protein
MKVDVCRAVAKMVCNFWIVGGLDVGHPVLAGHVTLAEAPDAAHKAISTASRGHRAGLSAIVAANRGRDADSAVSLLRLALRWWPGAEGLAASTVCLLIWLGLALEWDEVFIFLRWWRLEKLLFRRSGVY